MIIRPGVKPALCADRIRCKSSDPERCSVPTADNMSNLPNCPFELYVATPCRETIYSYINKQDAAQSIADVAAHFQQSVTDTIEEILRCEPGTFGYIFRSYIDYPGV